MEMWFVNDRNVKITKMKLIICVFVKSLVECFAQEQEVLNTSVNMFQCGAET